eukprot:TRINITY_DN3747_c1_g1_i1.p1 TRINITY_DN3747_c1_g1~~TRINITY_DN3747_c1_g1_i1.p1  ORF type:complete len:985 (-),score=347.22 TRINITY_DN3747_c1_g1_i1:23-2977(-)
METTHILFDESFQTLACEHFAADPVKKINLLSRLLQLVSWHSFDLSNFIPAIIKLCLPIQNQRTVRLLAYRVLKFCSLTDQEWLYVLKILFNDLNSEDEEIQISAIKLLPTVPTVIIHEQIKNEKMQFKACFNPGNHNGRPGAKYSTLETLSILLNRRHQLLLNESFIQTGWLLVCERLLDTNLNISQLAFSAVDTLIEESEKIHEDECNFDIGACLKYHLNFICSYIYSKVRALIVRAEELSLQSRIVTIRPLTLFCYKVFEMFDNNSVEIEQVTHTVCPSTIVIDLVQNYLLYLLNSLGISLIIESGAAILYLYSKFPLQQNWLEFTTTKWVRLIQSGQLNEEQATRITLELLLIIHNLEFIMLQTTALALLKVIEKFKDAKQRASALSTLSSIIIYKTKMQIKESLKSEKKLDPNYSTIVNYIFQDTWFQSQWRQDDEFQQDIVAAFSNSCICFLESEPEAELESISLSVGMHILLIFKDCIFSNFRFITYGVKQFICLLEKIICLFETIENSNKGGLNKFLLAIIDRIRYIQSEVILAHVILILSRHFTLASDYFFKTIFETSKSILTANWNQTIQQQQLSPSSNQKQLQFIHLRSCELILQSLEQLSSRSSSLKQSVISLTPEVVNLANCEATIFNNFFGVRVTSFINFVKSQHTENVITQDSFLHFPNFSELPQHSPNHYQLIDANNFVAHVLARSGFSNLTNWTKSKIEAKRLELDNPKLLTTSSDPISIELFHIAKASICTVSFVIRITNHTAIPFRNIQTILLLKGALEHPKKQPQFSCVIPYLAVGSSFEWSASVKVFALLRSTISVKATFPREQKQKLEKEEKTESLLKNCSDEFAMSLQKLIHIPEAKKINPDCYVPLIVQSREYILPINDFLIPLAITKHEFFIQWLKNTVRASLCFELEIQKLFPLMKLIGANYIESKNDKHLLFAACSWFNDVILFIANKNRYDYTLEISGLKSELIEAIQNFILQQDI